MPTKCGRQMIHRDNDAQSVNLGSPNFQPIPFCADLAFNIEWIRTPNKTW